MSKTSRKLVIRIGALAPTFLDQLIEQGYIYNPGSKVDGVKFLNEKHLDADAVLRLYIKSIISDSAAKIARSKIAKSIDEHVESMINSGKMKHVCQQGSADVFVDMNRRK